MPSLDSTSSRKSAYWTLAAITFLAAIIRFVGLTRDSLWTDEIFSGFASQLGSIEAVIRYVSHDVHPPGYFIALWAWAQLFGDSDYSLRALSALGGVLFVPLVFRLGRQLYDVRTGLLAAFFGGLLIQGIYYSQEVRAYIWMAVWSALAVSLVIDYVRGTEAGEKSALWWLAAATLVSIVNSYFHYFGLLFSVVLMAGLAGYQLRKGRRPWASLTSLVIVMVSFLPWLPVAAASVGKQNWIQPPTVRTVAETANTLYGPGVGLVVITLLVVMAGLAVGYWRKKTKSTEMGLIGWIVVPLIAALICSFLLRPVYSPRNMMFAFAAGCLILARAIAFFSEKPKVQWSVALGLMVAVFSVHFATGHGYLLRPVKQQVRETSQFIVDHNPDRAPIYGIEWDSAIFYYYLSRTDQLTLLQSVPEKEVAAGFPSFGEAEFWIASAGIDINLLVDLSKEFDIVERGEFIQARAYRLRRKAK